MKKSSSTLAVLLFASLVTGLPVFAAPTMDLIGKKDKDIVSDTFVAADNTGVSASNTVFVASETLAVGSDTMEIVDEVIAIDPFAADPYAGTSLKSLKKQLNTVEKLYSQSQEFASLALALNAAGNDDRFFRRNCELLIRLTKQQPLSAFAAMAIFPELLGVAEELVIRSIQTAINAFVGDYSREPKQCAALLVGLKKQLELTNRIAATIQIATENIANVTHDLALINGRRHISAPLAGFLKTANQKLIEAILQQQNAMQGLLNQFNHHQNFCIEKLAYLQATSTIKPGVIQAADLTSILRSSRDFVMLADNYKAGIADFTWKLTSLLQTRSEELDKLSKLNSSRSARMNDFLNHYPSRDISDLKEPVFKAETELANTFALLEKLTKLANPERTAKPSEAKSLSKTEVVEPALPEILSAYLNGSPWEINPDNKYIPVVIKSPESKSDVTSDSSIKNSEPENKEEIQIHDEFDTSQP